MVHSEKPCSLNKIWDLIQKINQCYWEQKGEILLAPKEEGKNDQSNKSNLNPCQNQAGLSNSNSKKKEKPKASTS